GEDVDQRLAAPRPVRRGVSPPAPQIGDDPAPDPHRDRGADLAALCEVGDEGIAQTDEARVAAACDVRRHGRGGEHARRVARPARRRDAVAERGDAFYNRRRAPRTGPRRMSSLKTICFYLPQYHPTADNDPS